MTDFSVLSAKARRGKVSLCSEWFGIVRLGMVWRS